MIREGKSGYQLFSEASLEGNSSDAHVSVTSSQAGFPFLLLWQMKMNEAGIENQFCSVPVNVLSTHRRK